MHQKGITLVELLFVLAIVACIGFFLMQDHGELHKKNEGLALQQNLATALRYAKITALAQGKEVYLAPLKDKNWALGIALYTLRDKALLYQWHWKFPAWKVSWQGFHADDYLIIAASPQNAASNGRFVIVHNFSQEKLSLSVNRLGRLTV